MKRLLQLIAVVLAVWLWLLFEGIAKASPMPPRRIEYALRGAAIAYRVDYWTLRRRAWCESRYNPRARNPVSVHGEHAVGLLQFLPSTWRTTPYRSLDVFNPYVNALAAAWMIRAGRGNEWECR